MIGCPGASDAKVRLFIAYSRLESSLKQAGYIKRGPRNVAQADWPRFAGEPSLSKVMDKASQDPDVRGMILDPPKIQVVTDDGACRWEQQFPTPLESLADMLGAVKQVRDNLFHGEKQGDDPRDESLCRAAWTVIRHCLKQHQEVGNLFGYRY